MKLKIDKKSATIKVVEVNAVNGKINGDISKISNSDKKFKKAKKRRANSSSSGISDGDLTLTSTPSSSPATTPNSNKNSNNSNNKKLELPTFRKIRKYLKETELYYEGKVRPLVEAYLEEEDDEGFADNFLIQSDDSGDEDGDGGGGGGPPKKKKKQNNTNDIQKWGNTTRATSYGELKERLAKKIEDLKKAGIHDDEDEPVDKATLSKRVKRRERMRKKKLKRKGEKEEKRNSKAKFVAKANPNLKGNKNKGNKVKNEAAGEKEEKLEKGGKAKTDEKIPVKKNLVKSDQGEIIYSKLDLISSKQKKMIGLRPAEKPSKAQIEKNKPVNLLKATEKLESKIEKLKNLGKSSEAVKLAEGQKWEAALKRSKGQKVRDDPFLLKKTIQKDEKIKKASQKKWKERTERVEKQKKERQDKRSTNIKEKKDKNKKKQKKLMRKKGRIE